MAVQVKASFRLTGWNGNQLKLRVPQILTAYGSVLDKQLKEDIQTAQFSWPRDTKRRNGSIASSPRDIVDTRTFLRSQSRDRPTATQLRFTWSAPYAPLIFTGYVTGSRKEGGRSGTVVPGRNWIKPALDKQPLQPFFARQWQQLSGQGL